MKVFDYRRRWFYWSHLADRLLDRKTMRCWLLITMRQAAETI